MHIHLLIIIINRYIVVILHVENINIVHLVHNCNKLVWYVVLW